MKLPFFTYGLGIILGAGVGETDFSGGWLEALKATGIVGICAFVLMRLEPRLRAVEAAIDRLARTMAVSFTALPYVIDAVKTQMQGIIRECDDAAAKRGEKGTG